jgi:TonB family protein
MRAAARTARAALVVLASLFVLVVAGRPARAQLDQPLPPPPERAEPAPAPKLTKPPALKKQVEPVYPPDAFAAGLAGDVTLTLDLDAEGHVTRVAVSKGAGHGFDEAAAAAARELEFSPAEVDGKPSPIRIEYTIHFKPQVVPPPPPPPEPEPPPPPEPEPPPAPPAPTRVTVRLRARERGTREPLVGADVAVILRGAALDGGDLPATVVGSTDDTGRFEVHAEAPGGVRVIVSDTAHDPCVRDVTPAELAAPAPVEWSCLARSRSAGQYEVRVHGKAEHPEETKQTLTRAELMTVPGTANDPLRVIQDLPGVARAPFGLGLLVVRGASPSETGVFIGGEPVPLLYHFLAGPSIFSAYLIDKLDFYPGGFGVRYGRFAGGAVDVTIKGDVGRTLHGAADVNLRDASAYVEGPVTDGWRASLAFRRSYIDQLLPLFIKPKIGSTFVTFAPVYYDYQGRVDHDLRNGHLAIVAYGSSDSFNVIAQDPTRMLTSDTHIGFHHVMGEWVTTFGRWSSRLAATFGYGDVSFDTGTAIDGFQRYDRLYAREDLTRRLAPSFAIDLGVDTVLSYDWAHYQIELPREGRTLGTTMPVETELVRSLGDAAPAVYVEGQWDITQRLRLVPGLRFDYYHVVGTDKSSFDPRLAARFAVTPRFAVKASAGIYHELPNPQFLDPTLGNPFLLLPWADQYQVGIEQRFTAADDLTATVYYVRRHDLPVATINHFSSIGQGRAYGLELLLRHQITRHFYGWIAYTLSRAEEMGTLAENVPMGGMGLPRNGSDLTWHLGQFDQPHNLVVVASYRFSNWETGLTYRLTSGTPTTPVVGSFLDADFNGYTREIGARASARNPAFSQLDARVERTFTFSYWVLGIYLDVQNVFNSENPEGTLYDYRFRQSASLRGLPILPILGVRGRF